MKKLYFAGQPGQGYGWGTCNTNLLVELGKLCKLSRSGPINSQTVFMPIADHALNPISNLRGKRNIGYCFFEFALSSTAAENAKQYDLIFCGSTWCKDRLAERGIYNTQVLIQGVDHDVFTSSGQCLPADKFTIFSGGKFEYRKGQDIVIAAVREFQKNHPGQSRLICAWHNPWPSLLNSFPTSNVIPFQFEPPMNQGQYFARLLAENGIEDFIVLPPLAQNGLAATMRSTDIGLFPNRCEGGTNLVLMEYMACGKPAIASYATGHLDIIRNNCILVHGNITDEHWCEIHSSSLASMLEFAFEHPKIRTSVGARAKTSMKQWTWERAARQIVAAL